MKDFDINKRIVQLFEILGIVQNKFAKEIGVSASRMSNITNERNKPDSEMLQAIINRFRNVNSEWLLVGTGKPFKDIQEENGKEYQIQLSNTESLHEPKLNSFSLKTDSIKQIQRIPIYDMQAMAGLIPVHGDIISESVKEYIDIPNIAKCDGAMYVYGDSMYSLLKAGDIVAYKLINEIPDEIFWGQIYILSLDMSGDRYITIKYVQKSEQKGHIKLVSYNEHHGDKDVKLSKVRAMALVKASVRYY